MGESSRAMVKQRTNTGIEQALQRTNKSRRHNKRKSGTRRNRDKAVGTGVGGGRIVQIQRKIALLQAQLRCAQAAEEYDPQFPSCEWDDNSHSTPQTKVPVGAMTWGSLSHAMSVQPAFALCVVVDTCALINDLALIIQLLCTPGICVAIPRTVLLELDGLKVASLDKSPTVSKNARDAIRIVNSLVESRDARILLQHEEKVSQVLHISEVTERSTRSDAAIVNWACHLANQKDKHTFQGVTLLSDDVNMRNIAASCNLLCRSTLCIRTRVHAHRTCINSSAIYGMFVTSSPLMQIPFHSLDSPPAYPSPPFLSATRTHRGMQGRVDEMQKVLLPEQFRAPSGTYQHCSPSAGIQVGAPNQHYQHLCANI